MKVKLNTMESFENMINSLSLPKLEFVNRWLINELKRLRLTEPILKNIIRKIAYCQLIIEERWRESLNV